MLHRSLFEEERGAGTVLTLSVIAVVLSLSTGLLTCMSIFGQWNEAKRVADQAALAGSIDLLRDTTHVCVAVAEVVMDNHLLLDECSIRNDYLVVRVGFVPNVEMARLVFPRIQVYSVATMQSGV